MSGMYWNPTRRLIADRALFSLGEFCSQIRAKSALIVLGEGSFRKSQHFAELEEQLAKLSVQFASPVESNPSIAFLKAEIERHKGRDYDIVIGIGGGSPLDVGKALALFIRKQNSLEDYLKDKTGIHDQPVPFIAIPTTAGTGSEVTQYASFETDTQQKMSLSDPYLFPSLALIDPRLTHGMPAYLTACTGFDALCQSIESFWSVHHTPFSETHSIRAVELILSHLERAVKDPADREARYGMSLASCEAGLAIAQTKTTAVHSVSYPLTTFFNIPHGHACALTLASFLRYNEECLSPLRASVLWRAMGVADASEAALKVERLMDNTGLERSLNRLGVDKSGIEIVLDNGFRPDRVKNNPRELSRDDLKLILEGIA